MIPTLILVGIGLGLIPRRWERRVSAIVALSVLISAGWGLLVGAPLGGALLALVNIAVGVALGIGVQRLGCAVLQNRSAPRTQRR